MHLQTGYLARLPLAQDPLTARSWDARVALSDTAFSRGQIDEAEALV
ncbi:MAG: hypothetical protein ACE5HB_01720 [Terriglobia bacterium]